MTTAERILHLLAWHGRPLKLDFLARELDVTRREVEAAVQELRLVGNVIDSGDQGVWLCRSRAEGLAAYRRLRSRCLTQLRTASAVKKAALRLPETGELTLGLTA